MLSRSREHRFGRPMVIVSDRSVLHIEVEKIDPGHTELTDACTCRGPSARRLLRLPTLLAQSWIE